MRLLLALWLSACLSFAASGPANGSLVVVGGGNIGSDILQRFLDLAGGVNSHFVVIPTAAGDQPDGDRVAALLKKAGAVHVTVLHTKDRAVADSDPFVAPLKTARGVWFSGGRQWRLVDSYMGTQTERALQDVLKRGGVIGGTSAGATIQGSYLVRGAREGNTIMMAPGYEKGFGYLDGVAVDQHLLKRKRERDLLQVIEKYPDLLGIGIDEGTAIVVRGNVFEVMGESKVGIYDHGFKSPERYYFLAPGERFDLGKRAKITSN